MDLHTLVTWSVIACFVYFLAVYATFIAMLIGSAFEHAFMTRQARNEDYDALATSRFTIPVSVIVPAYNEDVVIEATVKSLLALEYPEFEVVVVNDGSSDGTLPLLERVFDLERQQVFFRRQFESRPVRGIYRSRLFPNLVVIDKENGGKADALNAGLNLAKYRYICTVDADTVYVPEALLHGMRIPMRDPARVIGVTSNVMIAHNPETSRHFRAGQLRLDDKTLTNLQLLDYLRSFLISRLGWTRWNFMLCSIGAFAIWRRDVVQELGGFSSAFTCEDIEFTFRAHEHYRRAKQAFRIVALPEAIGRTEGPDTVPSLISQRARWQRVITETFWHYRKMFLNPRYGTAGLIGMPYYLLTEVLAPVFQTLSIATLLVAWWLGMMEWRYFVVFIVATGFANGVLTNVAILLYDRGTRTYPIRDMTRLMALGMLDVMIYRPILFVAQAKGLFDFLRGEKGWNKFARNERPSAA